MTQNSKITVGIVGLGSFGKFTAKKLPNTVEILAYDTNTNSPSLEKELSLRFVKLETLIEKSTIIVLAIPLASYTEVVPVIKSIIRPQQLLVDICSVKIIPEQIITKTFPDHPNLLISHPLFGARSFDQPGSVNRLIVTKSIGKLAEDVLAYCKSLDIETIRMSADKHDALMADIHALTFFVAKALQDLGLDKHDISTPSYKMITDLINFSETHTDSLIQTIENGNPYAQGVRDRLVDVFQELNTKLSETTPEWIK